MEPLRQGIRALFGAYEGGIAEGLLARHDHGSQYVSDYFQDELKFLGVTSSPAFVREPEGNGLAERFIRTLKEQLLWVRTFDTVEELRVALLEFKERYNRFSSFDPKAPNPGAGNIPGAIVFASSSRPTFDNPLTDAWGPRIGFAYALSKDGRTAIRGGVGTFFDRIQGNPTMNMVANPPTSFSPTIYYSTFSDLVASANFAVLAPSTISHSLYGQGTLGGAVRYIPRAPDTENLTFDVHGDVSSLSHADDLNRQLNARAFTTGKDVFFRHGEYSPGASSGRELLAHELTHVVQQNGDGIQRKMTVSQPGDAHELEADQMARAVMQQEHSGTNADRQPVEKPEEEKRALPHETRLNQEADR